MPAGASGSSCQVLSGDGSLRSGNGAFFSRLLLGCAQAGPANSSIPALSGQGGSEQGPAQSLGGLQEQGWLWTAGRAEQIPAGG